MRSFTSLIAILPPPLIIAVGLNRNAQTPPVQQTRIHRTHWHTLSVNPERWSKRSSRSAHSPWEGCETVNCLHNLQCLTLFFFLCISVSHLPDSPSQGAYHGGWKAGRVFFRFNVDQVTGEHQHWPIWISLLFICHNTSLKWVLLIYLIS